MHGGAIPAVRRKAKMRLAEADAKRALQRLDVEPVDDPVGALLALAAEVVALKDVLAGKWAGSRRDDEAAVVDAYGRALDRAGRLLVEVNRLGLEERLVRVREVQAARIVEAVRAALTDLGVDPGDEYVRSVLRRRIEALAGGEIPDAPTGEPPALPDPRASAVRAFVADVKRRLRRNEDADTEGTFVSLAEVFDALDELVSEG